VGITLDEIQHRELRPPLGKSIGFTRAKKRQKLPMVLTRIALWERLQPRIIVRTTIAAEAAPTVFKALKTQRGA